MGIAFFVILLILTFRFSNTFEAKQGFNKPQLEGNMKQESTHNSNITELEGDSNPGELQGERAKTESIDSQPRKLEGDIHHVASTRPWDPCMYRIHH